MHNRYHNTIHKALTVKMSGLAPNKNTDNILSKNSRKSFRNRSFYAKKHQLHFKFHDCCTRLSGVSFLFVNIFFCFDFSIISFVIIAFLKVNFSVVQGRLFWIVKNTPWRKQVGEMSKSNTKFNRSELKINIKFLRYSLTLSLAKFFISPRADTFNCIIIAIKFCLGLKYRSRCLS